MKTVSDTALCSGISSQGRKLPELDGTPFQVEKAQGPYIWDQNYTRYIDTVIGFGCNLLGHSPQFLAPAIQQAIEHGSMPGFAHENEAIAASAITRHTGELNRLVFINSGSEAVQLACQIARAKTGRRFIARFAGSFHGWHDEFIIGKPGSETAKSCEGYTLCNDKTLLLSYNDLDAAEQLFKQHNSIAALLIEPVLANSGCILPNPHYLKDLQSLAQQYGILLIADEVLMGFRLQLGLCSHTLGFGPDIATLGKAIGNGISVAAVIGKENIMDVLETDSIASAGTYNGNPVSCAAVIATIDALEQQNYQQLHAAGNRIRKTIVELADHLNLPISTSGFGNVFTLWFSPKAPNSYAEALSKRNPQLSTRLHMELRNQGVMIMPNPFGRLFLSFSHDDAIINALSTTLLDTLQKIDDSSC